MHRWRQVIASSIVLLGMVGVSTAANRSVASTPPVLQEDDAAFFGAANIRETERVLRTQGFDPGTIDSVVDEKTRQALRDFQRSNKLRVTGMLDDETTEKLVERGARFTGALGAMRDSQISDEYHE